MHTPVMIRSATPLRETARSSSARRGVRSAARPTAAGLLLLGAFACAAPHGSGGTDAVELLPGLEVVRAFDASMPPGNLAIAPGGRMFMSVHAFYGEPEEHVVELLEGGGTRPYPSADWARPATAASGPGMNGVLGVRVDAEGVLWMLDGQSAERPGRLLGWDTRAEQLFAEIVLSPPATTADSFLNDLAVDRRTGTVYVADSAGAVIFVDIASGSARRVLDGHVSTVPEDVDLVVAGRVLELGGAPARVGINPITLDAGGDSLYFGPMSGTSLYRVDTSDLRDATLSAAELGSRVFRYGDKPLSDGSTVDG
ncbi:MAG: L-dopachrome tautomerase-related protein, partial [Planctomycetota bacterium]